MRVMFVSVDGVKQNALSDVGEAPESEGLDRTKSMGKCPCLTAPSQVIGLRLPLDLNTGSSFQAC